jgi:hypothetical protein
MRLPRIAILSVSITLAGFITLLTGCGKSRDEAPGATSPSGGITLPGGTTIGKTPIVTITQTPEFPKPGQYVQYPRGLVAALWSDGRIVRCADPLSVGKSTLYVTGKVKDHDRDEFIAFLKSDEVMKAPKLPHLRLHAATLQTTITTDKGKEKWVAEVPNAKSVWVEVRKRLLNLPLEGGSKAAGENEVQDASKEN